MLPARFDYVAPTSLDEVLALLAEHGDDAKVLAGGQSLIPLMKLRLARPALLVDVQHVPGLDGIEEEATHLRVGAMVRTGVLAEHELIRERYPTMAEAAPQISDPIIRNRGTIGGSLVHADPAGDWGSVMLAMGAELVARSTSGERTIPIGSLFQGTFTTALEPSELLVRIDVPRPGAKHGGAYLKLERKIGDFATVAVAVDVEMDDGAIGRAGIGLTAVGAQNIAADEAAASLVGKAPTPDAIAEAARLAGAAADPVDDVRGSADYKRDLVRVFTRRGLTRAVQMAQA